MHVCPPLRLTNTDIGLVVCTAWVMWHQSDLQNSRGGAINHIGSGINHCVEDIFCHRCPLTITLFKMLAPSLLPFYPSFPPSLHQATKRPPIGLKRRERRERCPFRHSFKMQVKVYGVACVPTMWNALQQRDEQKTVKTLAFEINSQDHFSFHSLHPAPCHLSDNCHFSFWMLTMGTVMRAREAGEGETGDLSATPIHCNTPLDNYRGYHNCNHISVATMQSLKIRGWQRILKSKNSSGA